MQITNNKRGFMYEAPLEDGEIATVEYRWLKGSMVIMHTVVPKSGQGKGIGGKLMKHVLDEVREQGLKVILYCPFATKYVEQHPEYADLLDEAHKS